MWGPQILELRAQGWSYRRIEKELGCSRALISYHCTRHNVPAPAKVPFVPSESLTILLSEGVRRSDIADALNVPLKEVHQTARSLCLPERAKADSSYLRVKRRRYHLKLLAVFSKGGECETCGYSRSLSALEFHHRDPTQKDFTISANANRSWASIKQEISKCQLLCANCHREHHED